MAGDLLTDEQVEWIVNDSAELGVKIGNQFFFLYKGGSLIYKDAKHDDGRMMQWRPVFKREFGECCHPLNHNDPTRIGTVSVRDSEHWRPLPPADDPAAALSASPPARVGVPVRVAVGLQTVVEAGMERDWGIYKLRGDEPDESAWAYLNSIGYAFRAAILTATIQPPVVAEIAAAVEKP